MPRRLGRRQFIGTAVGAAALARAHGARAAAKRRNVLFILADRRKSETTMFDRLGRQYLEWDARMRPRPKEHGRVRT